MRAMRRKLAKLIIEGDGQATPAMFGIINAKNKAGESIFADLGTVAVDANLLDSFFYSYGSDDANGPNARLYLTKDELKAIGKLRNANMERVFKVRPDGSNPNVGTIEDSGVFIPYTIVPKGTTKMLYGDPLNYELGLFGDYTIRVDSSVKAVELSLIHISEPTRL